MAAYSNQNIFIGTRLISTFGTELQYSEYGNYLTKITDSRGNSTNYNYDSTKKLLKYVEDANSHRTAYIYNSRQLVDTVYIDNNKNGSQDSNDAAIMYLYDNSRLSDILTNSTEYHINYDVFGKMTYVGAGNNTIAQYEYASNNGHLIKLTYGNGDYEEYEYDTLDRLVKVYYNGSEDPAYSINYDANNNIRRLFDGKTTHVYDYDSLGRLIRAWQYDENGDLAMAVENSYDSLGRAKGTDYVIDDDSFSYDITYKADTDLVSNVLLPTGLGVSYTYDSFDRVTQKNQFITPASTMTSTYTYANNTNLLYSHIVRINGGTTTIPMNYTYDEMGNILTISDAGILKITCEYDSQNRLVYVANKDEGFTYIYRYDNAGNLTARHKFEYTTTAPGMLYISLDQLCIETINYGYSTSLWGDQLTDINGTSISYDGSGNPTNWHNARSLVWENQNLRIARNRTDDRKAVACPIGKIIHF